MERGGSDNNGNDDNNRDRRIYDWDNKNLKENEREEDRNRDSRFHRITAIIGIAVLVLFLFIFNISKRNTRDDLLSSHNIHHNDNHNIHYPVLKRRNALTPDQIEKLVSKLKKNLKGNRENQK